jgi:hypothetical protein
MVQKCHLDNEQKICEPIELDKEIEQGIIESRTLERKWSIIFNFSPFLAYYHPINLKLEDSNTNVSINNITPIQRTSFNHFEVTNPDATNFGQFLDEPQNKFTFEVTDGEFFIGIEYIHPKLLYQNDENEQVVSISGIYNGEEIDLHDVSLNQYFSEIRSTFGNANIDIFGGKIFHLLNTKRAGAIDLQLGIAAGLTVAAGDVDHVIEDDKIRPPIRINGYSVGTRAKLRYYFPRRKLNISIGHDFTYNRINGQLGNYQAETNIFSHRVHFGIGYELKSFRFKVDCNKNPESKKCRNYDFK